MTRVLIVDGGWPLRDELVAQHHEVLTAAGVDAALDLVVAHELDLIVLGTATAATVREVRAWTPVPLVVISDRSDPAETLDAGADDHLPAPVGVAELLARFRAITRREAGELRPTSIRVGRCRVDLRDRRVEVIDGPKVALTRTEWRLLEALVSVPGRLVPQHQLLQQIWGPAHRGKGPNLRQYMAQLRRKFEHDPARPRHLLTEFGVGCRFQP